MRRTLLVIVVVISIIISLGVFMKLLGKKGVGVLPISISPRKTYELVGQALDGNDYQKYASSPLSLPSKGEWSGEHFNPKTGEPLYLDTSYGGGSKCCEQRTFYLFIDKVDMIFWVEDYSASVEKVNEEWYGPFSYVTNPLLSYLREVGSYDELLYKDEYLKYPTNYAALPIGGDEGTYNHPTNGQKLKVLDKTRSEDKSLNIITNANESEFWIRNGNLNTNSVFWSWYGPFTKK